MALLAAFAHEYYVASPPTNMVLSKHGRAGSGTFPCFGVDSTCPQEAIATPFLQELRTELIALGATPRGVPGALQRRRAFGLSFLPGVGMCLRSLKIVGTILWGSILSGSLSW